VGDTGLEPVTPSLSSLGMHDVSACTKGLTTTLFSVCTNVCTNYSKCVHRATPERIAEAIRRLSPSDRKKLVEMLLSDDREDDEQ